MNLIISKYFQFKYIRESKGNVLHDKLDKFLTKFDEFLAASWAIARAHRSATAYVDPASAAFARTFEWAGTRDVLDNADYVECLDLTSLHLWLSSWLCRGRDGGGQTTKPPPLKHMINPH